MKLTDKQIEAFMAKVDKTCNCWYWKGAQNPSGYGVMAINGKNRLAHRISYGIYKMDGVVPDKVTRDDISGDKPVIVRHVCDRPLCVNPDHLIMGTTKENLFDRTLKMRSAASLTADAVREIRSKVVDWDTMCDMMKKHKTSAAVIKNVLKRRHYSHVQ